MEYASALIKKTGRTGTWCISEFKNRIRSMKCLKTMMQPSHGVRLWHLGGLKIDTTWNYALLAVLELELKIMDDEIDARNPVMMVQVMMVMMIINTSVTKGRGRAGTGGSI